MQFYPVPIPPYQELDVFFSPLLLHLVIYLTTCLLLRSHETRPDVETVKEAAFCRVAHLPLEIDLALT
ncbi:hypothetical protein VTO58DRAFT_104926 [Aureobasidium pullulans]